MFNKILNFRVEIQVIQEGEKTKDKSIKIKAEGRKQNLTLAANSTKEQVRGSI